VRLALGTAQALAGRLLSVRDDSASVITAGTDLSRFIQELQPFCDAGMVADLDLIDGTRTTGVLIGVSSSVLILGR